MPGREGLLHERHLAPRGKLACLGHLLEPELKGEGPAVEHGLLTEGVDLALAVLAEDVALLLDAGGVISGDLG